MRLIATLMLCFASAFAGELSNRRAPGFSLPDVNGKQYDLQDYRGKVVIVDIMRTDCPSCAAFAKVLVQVRQKYGDRVGILSVVNPPDDQPRVAQFIAGHKFQTPVLFDCGQVAYSYMRTTSFEIPHVFLIDASGVIREDWGHGVLTKDILEGQGIFPYIDRLLGASTAPMPRPKK